MSITLYLSALTMRSAVEGACESLGVGKAGPQVLTDLFARQFSDPSQRLNKALDRANDRAWRVLELALAGDSLWDRCKGLLAGAEYRAFRQQIQEFLAANPPRGLPVQDARARARCLDELQRARKAGLLTRGPADPQALARSAASLARYAGNPQAMIDAEWKAVEQVGELLRRQEFTLLPQLVSARLPQGQPLLVVASRYFFRREVEASPELSRSLTFSQLEGLSHAQQAGFEGLNNALTQHQHQLDQMLTGLADAIAELHGAVEQVGAVAVEARDTVLDVRDEMRELKSQNVALHQAVQKLLEQHQLQSRPVRGNDSLAIQTDQERQAVKLLLEQYRRLPEAERRAAPALLNGLGKLQLAVGDWEGAKRDFEKAAELAPGAAAKAEAHYNAYRAALESEKYDEALPELLQAARLDRKYLPFPLDKYTPEKILGAGGFGVTFRCRYRPTNGVVAVKTLSQEGLDRDVSEVFREAGTLDRLNHPAIVRLRECDFADPAARRGPYLVMEYFEGETLEGHVRKNGPLSLADLLAVARPVAEALQAAHAVGILHRDVKPANLLVRREPGEPGGVSPRWEVKLIDFGLALEQSALEARSTQEQRRSITGTSIAGTIDYAAPEQLGKEKAPVGPPADIYGFAKTCCYALFQTPQPTFQDWKRLPESLAEVLGACLHHAPKDRPADFSVLLPRLRPRSATPPVPVPSPPPTMPATPPPAKARLTWVDGRTTRTLHLYFTAVLEAGRQTTKPLCLRVEPVSDPANRDRSLAISSHHLTLRYLGDGVELIDPGSSNGTFVNRQRLAPGQPCWIQPGMSVWLADVLELQFQPATRRDAPAESATVCRAARAQADNPAWLQSNLIGADRPGWIAFLRILRKNNLPQEEYALLFHAGAIGGGPEALIRVGAGGDAARLSLLGGWPHLERVGAEMVAVSGRPLPPGTPVPLASSCDWSVGQTTFRLEY
jgi:serine/threonine protein kinase